MVERSTVQNSHQKVMQKVQMQVKDFVRERSIREIIGILQKVIENHGMFNEKTVKGALLVLSQLIDWNELQHFEAIVPPCQGFIKDQNPYRSGGIACLCAIVGKGMDPNMKVNVIHQLGYVGILNSVSIE